MAMARRRAKQLEFIGRGLQRPRNEFGGSLLKGNPKTKRPLDSKLPIHVVLRASRSGMRLPKTVGIVSEILKEASRKYGVTVYRFANVGNHLHLLIKVSRIQMWAPYIRELCGRIAQQVRAVIGLAAEERFWLFRPFTRIVRGWQKAFKSVCDYVYLNRLEAEGFISRKETRTLKDLRAIWSDGG